MARVEFTTGVGNINFQTSNSAFTTSTDGARIVRSGDLWIGNSVSNVGNVIVTGNANAYGAAQGALSVTGDAVFRGNVKVDGLFYEPNSSPRLVSARIDTAGSYTQPDVVCTVAQPDSPWGTQARAVVRMNGTGFSNTSPFTVTGITIVDAGSGYTYAPTLTLTSAGGGTQAAAATAVINTNYLRASYTSNADIRPGDVFFSYSAFGFTPPFGGVFYHDNASNNPNLYVQVGNAQAQVPTGNYKYLGTFFQFQTRGWFQRIS